jgi:endogenous inhibitor of DNA gyrase (YacG/DUF329 family)
MGEIGSNDNKLGKAVCPSCGEPVQAKHRPFCSSRCKQLDLGRWFNEDYRVPIVETDDLNEDDYPEE